MLALRLARAYTGRTKVLRFEGHFGWHDYVGKGAYPPFDKAVSLGIPQSTLDTILVIPADLDQVERTLRGDRDIAAVMLEPSGASWGTVPLTAEFNRELRELTTRYEVPLIYDEVIRGPLQRRLPGLDRRHARPGSAREDRAAACRWRGRRAHRDHEAIRLRRPPARPLRPCLAPWDVQRQPLSTASGIASLRLVADGSPGAQAGRMADLLRRGMEEILEGERAAGYVYGDSSVFHVYLEAYPDSGAKSGPSSRRRRDPERIPAGRPAFALARMRGRELVVCWRPDLAAHTGRRRRAATAFRRRWITFNEIIGRVG